MNIAALKRFTVGLSDRAWPVLAPPHHNRRIWLEVAVITLGALALGVAFHRDNPLQIKVGFPWVWLAPQLLALRYGVMPGLVSSLMFVATWEWQSYRSKEIFPDEYFLGGLLLVMLAAQFSMGWTARLRRAEMTNRYLNERLHRITRRHLLLRLSHDHMEREMLTRPITLREALIELRKHTVTHNESNMPALDSLLQLLAQYCQLESAAIFASPSADGAYPRLAAIGSPPDLDITDPLLAHAMKHQALSHLLSEEVGDEAPPSRFLVIAPIFASDGHLLGILAVERMPFLSLTEENLQMLSVLLGYYADCTVESDEARQFLEHFPDAPPHFAAEFSRMLRLQRDYGINSHVVVLFFSDDVHDQQVIVQRELTRRSLDVSWLRKTNRGVLLANLMPLADGSAVQECLVRVENVLNDQLGLARDEHRLSPSVISLAQDDPLASLSQFSQSNASC
jgi:polysaccharide biosynthesis protein PelD